MMAEKFSKTDQRYDTEIQNTQQTQSNINTRTHLHTLFLHIIEQLLKTNTYWKAWNYTGKEENLLSKEILIDVDIWVETVESGRWLYDIFNVLKIDTS